MDTKDIHEQRLWERYSHYLNEHETKFDAIEQAILDMQFFEEEIEARKNVNKRSLIV